MSELMRASAGEDVLIGKTSPLPEEAPGMAQRWTKRDVSTSLRNSESGMVDSVMLTTNDAGARFIKVRVRALWLGSMCCCWVAASLPPLSLSLSLSLSVECSEL